MRGAAFQDAGWLRRLFSLAKPIDPVNDAVANVQLVNDRAYSSSRERAPFASHGSLIAAAGAGVHGFVEIGGTDRLGAPVNLLHSARFDVLDAMANSLGGLVQIALADGATLTTATRVATTPMFADADPDVSPVLFIGTIASANIPASAATLPRSATIGLTAATPAFGAAISQLDPLDALPFARTWDGPRNCIFFTPSNTSMIWWANWQPMRA